MNIIFKNKKLILIVVSIIAPLFVLGFSFFLLTKQKIAEQPSSESMPEDVLISLTAPAGSENAEIPQKVLDSLTAPKGKIKPVPEDVLQFLTAPLTN